MPKKCPELPESRMVCRELGIGGEEPSTALDSCSFLLLVLLSLFPMLAMLGVPLS